LEFYDHPQLIIRLAGLNLRENSWTTQGTHPHDQTGTPPVTLSVIQGHFATHRAQSRISDVASDDTTGKSVEKDAILDRSVLQVNSGFVHFRQATDDR
jgi:hypothetical protein